MSLASGTHLQQNVHFGKSWLIHVCPEGNDLRLYIPKVDILVGAIAYRSHRTNACLFII